MAFKGIAQVFDDVGNPPIIPLWECGSLIRFHRFSSALIRSHSQVLKHLPNTPPALFPQATLPNEDSHA